MKWPDRYPVFLIFTGIITLIVLIQYGRIMLGSEGETGSKPLSFPLVERGPIYDRHGKVLAISTRLHSLTAWIPSLTQPEESSGLLSPILGISQDKLLGSFQSAKGFIYIKRKISPAETQAVEDLKTQGKLKGINLELEFGRSYPDRALASTVLGYVGTDNTGLAGIEYSLNDILLPPEIGEEKSLMGNSIFLTLDLNIQLFLRQAAQEALETHKADNVTILVADAQNAEILGYVNYPDFDPNDFNKSSAFDRQNRIAERSIEPGSVFKIFTVASMLEKKAIAPFSEFFCNGHYEKTMQSGEVISIKCNAVHGRVTPEEILRYSCNAGAAYASDLMDPKGFESALRDMGFGEKTGLPFSGEAQGIFPDQSKWSGRTKPTIAFGQEIGVTALQMIQAALIVAHQGDFIKPQLIKQVLSPTGEVLSQSDSKALRKVLSAETAQKVLDMLTRTVEAGTGQKARIEGILIGGKTGTAQVRDPATGKYSADNFIASMMTFMPATEPQFIIYVLIDHPRGFSIQGGQIAAPVTKKVGERLIHYFGMAKTGDQIINHNGRAVLAPVRPVSLGDEMPNLQGLSKRALLPLLSRQDYHIKFQGEGWVVHQSPPPGEPIKPGMAIELEFR